MCCCTGYYFTGDGALRDEDGDYRITGRVDDVVNIKGHRIGTAEIECAMVSIVCLVGGWVCMVGGCVWWVGVYGGCLRVCSG